MQQYLSFDQVEELHVEITNKCNAACPMCARNNDGHGLKQGLVLSDWQPGESEIVFDLPNLKRVFFCGTHGDPIASNQLLEAIESCKRRNIRVEIFTNGSLRSEQFWKTLTSILTKEDKIIFGIDGIETNHLYRQNTNIEKILKNLKMCCESEVKTQWDFLAFEHNEHELEKCKELSLSMGVNQFRIRKTARFARDSYPAKNMQGEITHYLRPPKNPELRHPDYKVMQMIHKNLPNDYNVECLYRQRKEMYVNSRLEVFPCCYIADNNENSFINTDPSKVHVPVSDMSLRQKSWKDILELSFYKQELVESFTNDKTLYRCVKTCGVVQRENNQSSTVFDK